MDKGNRSWLMFGLASSAVATSAVLVGMSHPAPTKTSDPKAIKGFSSRELSAKDILKSELVRRFTDRQNVDFGISRVIRPGTRLHLSPLMNMQRTRTKASNDSYRKKPDGTYELFVEGEWINSNLVKPLLSPENDRETEAVNTFKSAKTDVAIYTVGQFELDTGEVAAIDPNAVNLRQPPYSGFQWGRYDSLRAKGPAYVSQKSTVAPRAHEVVDFGRRAWASKQMDFVQEGKDGWVYFAHRVDAPDMSCGKCHGDRTFTRNGERVNLKGAVQKEGDGVGLFVIAMRRK